ncbi:hypothetical protein AACH06_01835 [Ideonella sp. DXS29W]|uniref:Macro domain-containing protein n=1 Tax=Ideonella lacteola TaxID=2984193 RepID=A0ABU9BM00_9BURK
MNVVQGDLIEMALQGHFDVIVQGCNCQCRMARGIALTIRRVFPEAQMADSATKPGDRAKLGTISTATVHRNGHAITIVNGYTQFHWAGAGVKADYDAIRLVMQTVRRQFSGLRIGYPKIGAGLAGGDWATIRAIISEELAGEDHTYVEFEGGDPVPVEGT